jgi:RNA polymerase sigma-70 factor (ECF subfamily)
VAAWEQFVAIYAPAIYRTARRLGLQAADAEDCVQEVLAAVSVSVTKWIQRDDRGPFRSWLFRIARNTATDFLTRRKHRLWTKGGTLAIGQLGEHDAEATVPDYLESEYRREIFLRSSKIVRTQVSESTWQAFYRTSVLQQSPAEVAEALGMTPGSVYIARSRVMKRLQQLVKSFEELADDQV